MEDRYLAKRQAIEAAVLDGAGELATSLRRDLADGRAPEELRALVDKIERHAHRVTDDDLAALRPRYSQDALFEIIAAATLGAARRRLDAVFDAAGFEFAAKGGRRDAA